MAQTDPNVNDEAGKLRRVVSWIDTHPRTGWYVAAITTLNFAVSVIEVFH